MDLNLATTQGTQILIMILFVLTMMLRSSKNIPNWLVQWIVLAVALPLSYLQSHAINIDVIMNAFMATGVCIFGENAIFRKNAEKTDEENEILKVVGACNKELSENQAIDDKNSKSVLDIDEDELKNIVKKVMKEVKTK